jgi:uncharacterized membrane protein YozB (DUF420 family)
MPGVNTLPALDASLNAISGILLLTGRLSIRHRHLASHRACMLAAFCASALFLACYLVYHATAGSRPFPGVGFVRPVYFTLLISHVLLAASMLPLALVTLSRGLRGQYDRHVRIARWTFPIWVYVSATGIVIYVMLYQMY